MSNTIKVVNSDLSRSTAIETLSNNDQILEGRIEQQAFDELELDQLYTDLSITTKYYRNVELGHTSTTYNSWTHVRAEAGYSIWSFPITNFADDTHNALTMDDDLFEYKGTALSESTSSFTKVLDVLNGVCYNVTVEAGTDLGTAFCFIQSASSTSYLLLCGASTFNAVDFDIETLGSNYSLKLDYWNGSQWNIWDGACTLSVFTDNTTGFRYSGRVEWTTPTDWATSTIDGTLGYWARLKTANTPSVIAKAYSILPGDSVPTLLSLTESNVVNAEWKWCYFNNKVYATFRNIGDYYYEGDLFIRSATSTENKINYFVNNHTVKVSYENSAWVTSPGFAPTGLSLEGKTKNQILAISPTDSLYHIYFCTNVPTTNPGSLTMWNGVTWVIFLRSSTLLAL